MAKALIDWTDAEIRQRLRDTATTTDHSYNSFVAELDRRAANRQTRASLILSAVAVVIATMSVVITALR